MGKLSYDNAATLYLIPTPIGNLGDITYRAIEVLKEVSCVFCEDTREASKLLNEFEIKKKLFVANDLNEEKAAVKILNYLNKGESVALISDRGTPVISDPGFKIVTLALENDKTVVALPGATAFVPALVSSGIEPRPFCFYGFLNSKDSKRKEELIKLKNLEMTLIFYESPHRIIETLKLILETLGDRKVSVSREISKLYEEIYRGKISEIIVELNKNTIKGEFVIVLEGNKEKKEYSDKEIIKLVNQKMEEGLSKTDSIKWVSKKINERKTDVYRLYHRKED